jgi:hypothetical protein
MRQVGIPNSESGVVSAAKFEEEIEYKFTSNGYELHDSHFLGDVRDASGNSLGYKMMMVFVKDEVPTARKTLKET